MIQGTRKVYQYVTEKKRIKEEKKGMNDLPGSQRTAR